MLYVVVAGNHYTLEDYYGSAENGWIDWCLLPASFLTKVWYIGIILLIPTFLDEIDGISYDTFEQRKPGETLKFTAGIAQTRSMIPKQCRNSEVKNAPYEEFFSYFWYHLRAYDRWYHVSTPNIRVGTDTDLWSIKAYVLNIKHDEQFNRENRQLPTSFFKTIYNCPQVFQNHIQLPTTAI